MRYQRSEFEWTAIKPMPPLRFVLPPADDGILTTRFRQSVLGDESLYN